VVAHTSDLHLGGSWRNGEELAALSSVLVAAARSAADVLVLAGDIFDSNRVPATLVDRASKLLEDFSGETVVLPGNHDPATREAVYRLQALADVPRVHVIGVDVPDTVRLPHLDIEIWGRAHLDYVDMEPLAEPGRRAARWRIAVAHGHYVRGPHDHHRSWRIYDHEIDAADADYVALGHWDLPQAVGSGRIPAYYSGSPLVARTINIARLTSARVEVTRSPLDIA
jgi:DNA repair exonuclease SbcCD nuclease subunit